MYEIYIESAGQRDLKRLSPLDLTRVIAAIKALADNPRPKSARKIIGSQNDWRIRIGKLRAIYEIDDRRKQVRIMRIRHRKEVYR